MHNTARCKLTVNICVAAQRPAEDRQAAAQKAADTRAERYGDEVKLAAVLLSSIFDLQSVLPFECQKLSAFSADPLRQEVRSEKGD